MSLAPHALTVGVDIGGTNIRAAVVDADGNIVDQASTLTPQSPTGLVDELVAIISRLRQRHAIEAVGLAVAGFINPECTHVRFAPHLPWRDTPVREIMEDRLGLPVTLEHDANAAAWGEHAFGPAQQAKTWVFFSVGTGIGATIMHDGEIFRGAYGTAPEFGHVTVVPGGRACSCGKQGCLERYASGTALVDTAREIVASNSEYAQSPLGRAIATMSVRGEDIMTAARQADPLAMAVVDDFAEWLGLGLSFVGDIIDPELIVVGGGVVGDAELFLPKAQRVMSESLVGAQYRPHPAVAIARLGSAAGMIGVANLARYR